jgi:preprotein translocase subunit YajC
MENLYNICWYLLAQTQVAGSSAAGETAATTTTEAAKPGFLDGMGYMFPALMAVMLLYFIMTAKPQQKGQERASELLANLKKNDKVVTAGGILGTVVNYRSDSEFVTVRIDDSNNGRLQVLATSIVRVVSENDEE